MEILNKVLNDIILDWSMSVSNGIPNFDNKEHLLILKKILNEKLDSNISAEVFNNLVNKNYTNRTIVNENFDIKPQEEILSEVVKQATEEIQIEEDKAIIEEMIKQDNNIEDSKETDKNKEN